MVCCFTTDKNAGNCGFATSLGLLLVRLALGAIFIYYGGQHLFGLFGGRGLHAFAKSMFTVPPLLPTTPAAAPIASGAHTVLFSPLVWAALSACTEFFGGILLLVGLLARVISIPIIVDMIVALWIYRAEGFGGYDFNVALIAMAALVLLAGPGMISLDRLVFRRGLWSYGPQPVDTPAERK